MNFETELTDEKRSEWAKDLAFDLDEFFRQAQALQDQPDDYLTGEKVQTPRGSFSLTSLSKEQMEAADYGVHHNSDDGRYHIIFLLTKSI